MVLGMNTATFTIVHVIISLIAIAAGMVTILEIVAGRGLGAWNALFLATTVATSVTGFCFHSASFGPPHVIGGISLAVIAIALFALYAERPKGHWRAVYASAAVMALYLNIFVGIVQAFQKLAPLRALAPTQTEPPFFVAQATLLCTFFVVGVLAVRRLGGA